MFEFLEALPENPFLQHALILALLASVSCGVVGTYVVTRRITFIAGGLSHCVLGGMGAAHYLQKVHGIEAAHPVLGATLCALLAALVIGWVSLRHKEREDTIIGALWAVGMATGILFLARTPGYNQDLMSYLFGNILFASARDLWITAALDLVVVCAGLFFFNPLQAVCFDEEFGRLRGLKVEVYYMALLALTALTVVILSTVVGIILVIAMLTLPVAMASLLTRTLAQTMVVATGLCAFFTFSGLVLSYGPDLPAGATAIVLTGAGYLLALIFSALRHRRHQRRPNLEAEP